MHASGRHRAAAKADRHRRVGSTAEGRRHRQRPLAHASSTPTSTASRSCRRARGAQAVDIVDLFTSGAPAAPRSARGVRRTRSRPTADASSPSSKQARRVVATSIAPQVNTPRWPPIAADACEHRVNEHSARQPHRRRHARRAAAATSRSMNTGGIRLALRARHPRPTARCSRCSPFGNSSCVSRVTCARDLRDYFDRATSAARPSRHACQRRANGVTHDPRQPPGLDHAARFGGRPLDDQAIYTVVLNDFIGDRRRRLSASDARPSATSTGATVVDLDAFAARISRSLPPTGAACRPTRASIRRLMTRPETLRRVHRRQRRRRSARRHRARCGAGVRSAVAAAVRGGEKILTDSRGLPIDGDSALQCRRDLPSRSQTRRAVRHDPERQRSTSPGTDRDAPPPAAEGGAALPPRRLRAPADAASSSAREYGATMPRDRRRRRCASTCACDDARNLEDYLARFDVTLSVMQTAPALERIAYELAEDAAREGVRYIEVRYAPGAQRARRPLARRGGRGAAARPRARRARARRRRPRDRAARCATCRPTCRSSSPSSRWRTGDRASSASTSPAARRGIPARTTRARVRLRAAITTWRAPATPAKATAPESVRQAVHVCGAHRIGHATRLIEDAVAHRIRERPAHRARDLSHEQRADARRRVVRGRIRSAQYYDRGHERRAQHRQPADERHDAHRRVRARRAATSASRFDELSRGRAERIRERVPAVSSERERLHRATRERDDRGAAPARLHA